MEKETLEEAAENYGWRIKINTFSNPVKANDLANSAKQDFMAGAEWQQEKMYSEEEVLQLLLRLKLTKSYDNLYDWFQIFKKK
jgi:hypothetical protein